MSTTAARAFVVGAGSASTDARGITPFNCLAGTPYAARVGPEKYRAVPVPVPVTAGYQTRVVAAGLTDGIVRTPTARPPVGSGSSDGETALVVGDTEAATVVDGAACAVASRLLVVSAGREHHRHAGRSGDRHREGVVHRPAAGSVRVVSWRTACTTSSIAWLDLAAVALSSVSIEWEAFGRT